MGFHAIRRTYALRFPATAPPVLAFSRSFRNGTDAISLSAALDLAWLIVFSCLTPFYPSWDDDACYHRLASAVSLRLALAIPFR